ncbi:uncharacterized protein [Venturia canescens]|uniref:uncharacterized protein n=1 Tax=Venturia canescens TaxID=32260 RepID=UPI001C9CFB29|nr:uncharacterized protein LOC122406802 [Venturia canescens]
MAHLRLLAVLIVAVVSYVALIDTAAVRSEEFSEQLQRMAFDVGADNLRTQRAIETGEEELSRRYCINTPCGWAVYAPYTRTVRYFMQNTCECPDETFECVRADDDLSVSAYVYRCRQNTTAADIKSPDYAN